MLKFSGINKQLQGETNDIAVKIMNREIQSPNEIAQKMFELFEKLVRQDEMGWTTPTDLKQKIKFAGELLISKDKLNFVVRNCVARMLKVLKDTAE